MEAHTTPMNSSPRRWPRQRLDVPLRVVIHTADKTVIRDGRACELSEGGMSFAAGVELKTGDRVEIEFTPAYSGLPIRVCAIARNGNGYKYGAEFVASNNQERHGIASLRENLQTLLSSYSPSCSRPTTSVRRRKRQSGGRPTPGDPQGSATALLNVSCPAPKSAPLLLGSRSPVGKVRHDDHGAQARSIEKELGTMPRGPAESKAAGNGVPSPPLSAAVVPRELGNSRPQGPSTAEEANEKPR
jgi:PilZ domain